VSTSIAHLAATLVDMHDNRNRAFASILICATVLMFVALLGHPAAGGGQGLTHDERLALIYEGRFHLGVMHGAAIAIQLAATTCVIAFCALIGLNRPLAALAAVAFASATAGMCVAASLDGFLIPAFAQPHLTIGTGPVERDGAIAAGAIAIQYATKFALGLMAISVLLLSLELLSARMHAVVGWAGLGLSLIQGIALVTFAVLTPHNIAFSALPLLIWQLVLGIAWRARPEGRA
jgi:hypothetical protein